MKKWELIRNEIRENIAKIEELNTKADNLYKKAEIRSAATYGDRKKILESITEQDEAEAVKLYSEANYLEKINKILAENEKASFTSYVISIIAPIMQKYNGKPLGEKTEQKIREEAHKHGISFYFNRGYLTRESSRITAYCLTSEGCKAFNAPEVEFYAVTEDGKHNYFINESNKIADFSTMHYMSHYNYTENPAELQNEIDKQYYELKKLVELASKVQSNYNSLLPYGSNHINAVDVYKVK